MSSYSNYLPGINELRFLAALFVILAHGQNALVKLNIFKDSNLAVFNRGGDAVEFFFTLSGFLITYLLLKEYDRYSTISIKRFYMRRILRIWPLYFLIVFIGFVLLGFVYPRMFHTNYFEFKIWEGLILYTLFLSNYVSAFYHTGLLHPLWSIGVEEQYYLFWAPLFKLFGNNIARLLIGFTSVSIIWYVIVYYNLLSFSDNWLIFLVSQKFYAMAIGSCFGFLFYRYIPFIIKNKGIFAPILYLAIGILFLHYFNNIPYSYTIWFRLILSISYGVLIIGVINPSVFHLKLDFQPLDFLGRISYGLYMYHMVVDYFLRTVFGKINIFNGHPWVFSILYHFSLIALTIVIASISYSFFELRLLNVKKRFSLA